MGGRPVEVIPKDMTASAPSAHLLSEQHVISAVWLPHETAQDCEMHW